MAVAADTSWWRFRRPRFKSASASSIEVANVRTVAIPRPAELGRGLVRLSGQDSHLVELDIKPLVNVAEVLVGGLTTLRETWPS